MTAVAALRSLMLAAVLAQAQAPEAAGSEKPSASGPATLLTLEGGVAVQLLEVSRRPTKETAAGRLNVGYWTGPDARSLSTETGLEVEVLRAHELFQAFRTWAMANGIQEVVLSAAAGRPGEAGRILDLYWTRGASGDWEKGTPRLREMTLPAFPTLPVPVVRDSDQEAFVDLLGVMYTGLLASGQFEQALKLMGPDKAAQNQAADLARATGAMDAMYGKVKERKPLAWIYSVAGGRAATDNPFMVRYSTITDLGWGTEDVTFATTQGGDWRVLGYQRFGQLGAGLGDDTRAVAQPATRPNAERPSNAPAKADAVRPPAKSTAADAIKARLFGRWKVVGHQRLRGSPGVDDPGSWTGAEIDFNEKYFGDQTCRCEGPVASTTNMTVADFFDREFRDTLAVPGMAPDQVVTIVTAECRGGRHLPWKGGLMGACVATTPFETMVLLKNGDVMVFGASWAYTLRKL